MDTLLVGCGLMGGSMALDLKAHKLSHHVYGYDIDSQNLEEALNLGLVDSICNWRDVINTVEFVVVAIPVDKAPEFITEILSNVSNKAVVIDLGSTKQRLCRELASHPNRGRFVATHPIAGTENSGPGAAFNGLFKNKVALICDSHSSDPDAIESVKMIYNELGSEVVEMSSESHDKHVAYVSHLSHISSFTLGLTVLDIEKNESNIHMLAGSGFDSTVRLAKSSPDMWEPIFIQNKRDITTALDEYIEHLTNFRALIADENRDELREQMKRANTIRKILS